MKTLKRILGALLVLSLVLSLGAVSAFADDAPTSAVEGRYEFEQDPDTLKSVKGTEMTFDKYLVLNKGADVPDVQFKFVIEAGPTGDEKGEEVLILPKDKNDVSNPPAAIAKDWTVIGKPVFVTGDGSAPVKTAYDDDSAILTYQKSDGSQKVDEESTPPDKTIYFSTEDKTDPNSIDNRDEMYVAKTLKISFANVEFLEPGVYRYTIKEIQEYTDATTPLPGMMFDDKAAKPKERTLDVYVEDINGVLNIAGYVLHETNKLTLDPDEKGTYDVVNSMDSLDDKSTGFTNRYPSKSLAIKKEVKGNQASRDKFFKITVKITPPGSVDISNAWYELDMTNDKWVFVPNENVATAYSRAELVQANSPYIAASNLKIENNRIYVKGSALTEGKAFYLQHGNSIMIRNLPAEASYSVAELEEDYKMTEHGVLDYDNLTSGVLLEQDRYLRSAGENLDSNRDPDPDGVVYTSFLNTRSGVIPTGVLTVIGPAVAVILLGMIGLGAVLVGKRRRAEDAE